MRTPALFVAAALAAPVLAHQPTPEQIAWIQKNAVPLASDEAGNGFDDLAPLKAAIGDARIVSLGEPTHGTRECFQMKHRLMEFLAAEMGFTLFSIEASMPEAYRLNEYVLEGKGDPAELIKGMHFWTWSTDEVLAMVEWMRRFNEAGAAGRGPVRFTGFDMQFVALPIEIARGFVAEADPEFLATAEKAWGQAESVPTGAGGPAFGVATGAFPVNEARGKHVRYSGMIRTEKVDQHAGLWWRVDGPDGAVLAFDNMSGSGPRGDTGWAYYAIEFDVPREAANINFGVIMPGGGTAWFDSLKVELDGVEYANAGAFDFTFDGPVVKGLMAYDGPTYSVGIDDQVAAEGEGSLRIRRLGAAPIPNNTAAAASAAARRCEEVLDHLEASRDKYLERFPAEKVDWAIQNARIVVQALRTMADGTERDKAMAANVAWILEQNPGEKIVLWAHNGHVWRGHGAMGSYLEERFGDDHLAVGFATGEGEYSAIGGRGGKLQSNPLASPPAESVEALCRASGLPRFVIDLRRAEKGSAGSGWAFEDRPFRLVGALAMDNQFFPNPVGELFDLLIYQDRTTAAVPISK